MTTTAPDTTTTTVDVTTTTPTTHSQTSRETTTRETTTAEYVRPLDYDLRIANYPENETEIAVTIEAVNESNASAVFDRTVTLASDGSKEFDIDFPRAGTYRVSASVAGQNATFDWDVRTENPDSGASVVVDRDGGIRINLVAI
ncbi:carbohydrate-binding protein [Halorussus amylolyticus]|uniref:hypothetical protein n=1 Tax=Halorussus amylolyticus TaxID=1126242 RepID=UPI00138F1A9D|nr:hypothetical protein [Halorussus amylolyticus]